MLGVDTRFPFAFLFGMRSEPGDICFQSWNNHLPPNPVRFGIANNLIDRYIFSD